MTPWLLSAKTIQQISIADKYSMRLTAFLFPYAETVMNAELLSGIDPLPSATLSKQAARQAIGSRARCRRPALQDSRSLRQHNPSKARSEMRHHLQSLQRGYKVLLEAQLRLPPSSPNNRIPAELLRRLFAIKKILLLGSFLCPAETRKQRRWGPALLLGWPAAGSPKPTLIYRSVQE